MLAGVHRGAWGALVVGDGAGHQVAQLGRLAQDPRLARIGFEGLARRNAQRRQHPEHHPVARRDGLVGVELTEQPPVGEVGGLGRLPEATTHLLVAGHRRIGALVPAVEPVLAHGGLGHGLVGGQAAGAEPHLVAGGAEDPVARGHHLRPTGGKDQVLASGPLVGPGLAKVGDRLLPDVEHTAGCEPGRYLHHQRPLLGQIPEAEGVEGGDVGGEHPRLVLQRAVEQHIAVAHAHGFGLGVVEGLVAHRRQGPEVCLGGALQVEFVVELAGCGGGGVAVLQLQPSQSRPVHAGFG